MTDETKISEILMTTTGTKLQVVVDSNQISWEIRT